MAGGGRQGPVPSAPDAARDGLYDPKFSPTPDKKPAQSCPYATEHKPCCPLSLSLTCGHGDRAFTLTPPKTKTDKAGTQVIELLADHSNQDSLKVTFTGGPCKQGRGPTLPSVKLAANVIKGSQTLQLSAPQLPTLSKMSIGDFMNLCFGHNDAKNVSSYSGNVQCCQGGQEFNFAVRVFAYRKWAGQASLTSELDAPSEMVGYTDYGTTPPTPKRAKLYAVEDAATIKFTGNIDVTFGAKNYKVDVPTREFGRTSKIQHKVYAGGKDAVFGGTERFMGRVMPRLRNMMASPLVTLTPLWPSLVLGGEVDMAEVKGRYDVRKQGKAFFKADPLIGLSGRFDILMWLLGIGAAACGIPPSVSLQLAKIREAAEEGVGGKYAGGKAVARIDFTASGKIGGSLQWAWGADGKGTGSGAINGDLDFEVKGEVSVELRVLVVSYIAGASIAGKTGLAGEIKAAVGDEPGYTGTITFKGLTIEAVTLRSAGGSSVGNAPSGAAAKALREKQMAPGGSRDDKSVRSTDTTTAFKIEVIPEVKWVPWERK